MKKEKQNFLLFQIL